MATGIIAGLSQSTSLTYKAKRDCKMSVAWSVNGAGVLTVNGAIVTYSSSGFGSGVFEIYIGLGQTVLMSTGVGVSAIVSVLES